MIATCVFVATIGPDTDSPSELNTPSKKESRKKKYQRRGKVEEIKERKGDPANSPCGEVGKTATLAKSNK